MRYERNKKREKKKKRRFQKGEEERHVKKSKCVAEATEIWQSTTESSRLGISEKDRSAQAQPDVAQKKKNEIRPN